jgi:nicotinic acid mononucleotide adenylyltransferase
LTVLVPLEDELRRLRRALRLLIDTRTIDSSGSLNTITFIRTGPGAAAIERCIRSLPRTESESTDTIFILAGCAGGLSPRADHAQTALLINDVRSLDHQPEANSSPASASTRCALAHALALDGESWSVLGVDGVLRTPATKARAFARTHADIVDTESHAFARAMIARGGRWLIIRGLSDRHDESLPPGVERFVDEHGRTRISAVLWAVLRRPTLLRTLLRLGSRTEEAMGRVARTLVHVRDRLGLEPTISPLPGSVLSALRDQGGTSTDDRPVLTIMGGSFDPFTLAHAQIALAGVHASIRHESDTSAGSRRPSALLLIPAGRSPHKAAGPIAEGFDRQSMIEATLRGLGGEFDSIAWGVWDDEIRRLLLRPDEPSYSVHTAARLRTLLNSEGLSRVQLRWIIGADQALAMHRWHDVDRFLDLADPIVLLRPDSNEAAAPTWQAAADRLIEKLRATNAWDESALSRWRLRLKPGPLLPGSSTRARELLAAFAGPHALSEADRQRLLAELGTLLSPSVIDFILQRGLYGRERHESPGRDRDRA